MHPNNQFFRSKKFIKIAHYESKPNLLKYKAKCRDILKLIVKSSNNTLSTKELFWDTKA